MYEERVRERARATSERMKTKTRKKNQRERKNAPLPRHCNRQLIKRNVSVEDSRGELNSRLNES